MRRAARMLLPLRLRYTPIRRFSDAMIRLLAPCHADDIRYAFSIRHMYGLRHTFR